MTRQAVFAAQSAYYVTSGLWPLVSMRSFTAVTGPKTDLWLVRMVAALAVANGAALGVAAVEDPDSFTARAVALGSALSFAAIDVVYVLRKRISPIYLGDAALELGFAAAGLIGEDL